LSDAAATFFQTFNATRAEQQFCASRAETPPPPPRQIRSMLR